MNYVSEQNLSNIVKQMAQYVGSSTGVGLEDWQAEHEYKEKDICVYEGQIYRAKVGFTSDITFNTTQILEEYTPIGGETIIPYAKDTEITTGDIVSYDGNDYEALYDFVCGEEFSLYALEEYVPQELTEVQEAEIINHFMPNIYSGGNMSIEDSTPIGTIISFMGTIAPENYLVCDGETYNIVDYIELADFIKEQFGSYNYFGGDGITTFAVPDLQGEFLRMTGTNSHTNQGSGANVGVHQDGTAHPYIYKYSDNSIYINGKDGVAGIYNSDKEFDISDSTNTGRAIYSATRTDTYNDEAQYTSRPTNTSVLYCIKYQMSITNAEEIRDLTTADIQQIINAYNPVFEEAKGIEYSTEERRIGTWIDGKPLYQKTIDVGVLSSTIESVNVNASVDKMIKMSGFAIDTVNGYVFNVPRVRTSTVDVPLQLDIIYDGYSSNVVKIFTGTSTGSMYFYITLQYTKTTD